MRAQLESLLHHQWDRRGPISWLLLPFSGLFMLGATIKRRRTVSKKLPVPVVVVGNIYVGGTGKTPVTIALVKALQENGWNPGVISRGYKGNTEEPIEVLDNSNPDVVGDEPLLIKKSTHVPTFVCPKRISAGQELLKKYPSVDVIISDDGLQHYELARDIELAVVGARGLGNRWVLPAGPLRESPSRLSQVDAIVLNATDDIIFSSKPRFAATSGLRTCYSYSSGEEYNLDTLARMQFKKELKAIGVAGIAVPERFFSMLRAHDLNIEELALPDHYDFDKNPFAKLDADLIFITEKDAVKCRKHPEIKNDPRIFVVPLEMVLDKHLIDFVIQKLNCNKRKDI